MTSKNAILHMDLDSPIWNGKKFLKNPTAQLLRGKI
jgi:hypothetical protein